VLLWQIFTIDRLTDEPVSATARCNNQNITAITVHLSVQFALCGQIVTIQIIRKKIERPLVNTSRIYKDNIEVDCKEVMWELTDWIHFLPYSDVQLTVQTDHGLMGYVDVLLSR
jgi:hypothetical protein